MEITKNDLLAAIEEALQETEDNPEGALSTKELVKITGFGNRKVLNALHELMDNDKLQIVQAKRKNIIGVIQKMKMYKLKKD